MNNIGTTSFAGKSTGYIVGLVALALFALITYAVFFK